MLPSEFKQVWLSEFFGGKHENLICYIFLMQSVIDISYLQTFLVQYNVCYLTVLLVQYNVCYLTVLLYSIMYVI